MSKLKIGFGWYVAEGTWYKNMQFYQPVYLCIIQIDIWQWTKPCQNPDIREKGQKMLLG